MSEIILHDKESFRANLPQNSTVLNNASAYEHTWRIANVFASSGIVPKHYQDNPQATFVALDMARQLEVNAMMFLQSTHQISGNIGMSTALMISLANTRGNFKGPIKYKVRKLGTTLEIPQREKTGWDSNAKKPIYKVTKVHAIEDLEVIAWNTTKDGEIVESIGVTLTMAMIEGWTDNIKYISMPEYMLRKRAAAFFVRENCPEVLNGLHTEEELMTEIVTLAPTLEAPIQTPTIEGTPIKSESIDTSTAEQAEVTEVKSTPKSTRKTKTEPTPEPIVIESVDESTGEIIEAETPKLFGF